MAFHCASCNGSMVFDVASQQMLCQHCGSTCDPNDYALAHTDFDSTRETIHDDSTSGIARFVCQNCGAQLEGTEDSFVGFCPYCGGQSMVREAGGSTGIENIVPFQVTKEHCVELFLEYAKEVPFLAKELKDAEVIQKFIGVYMPFYQYDVQIDSTSMAGYKTVEHTSSYCIVERYRIEARADGLSRGALFDGSRYLDDQISARSQPFNMQTQVPFNPAYLSGFYADVATVSSSLYAADAEAQVAQGFVQRVAERAEEQWGIHRAGGWEVYYSSKQSSYSRYRGKAHAIDDASEAKTHATSAHLTLLPLWFLTIRKGDRVAYGVVNGESGKVVSDLPLDYRSFAFGSVWTSVAVFVLLELVFQPTPMMTTAVSLLAAYAMGRGILVSARQEWEQQSHAYDKGYHGGQVVKRKRRRGLFQWLRRKKVSWPLIVGVAIWLSFWVYVAYVSIRGAVGVEGIAEGAAYLFTGMALCNTLLVGWRVHKWGKSVRDMVPPIAEEGASEEKKPAPSNHATNRDLYIAVMVLLVSVIINAAMAVVAPVDDSWYYLGDGIGILGLIAAAVLMIRVYNASTTRPLPKLFDRAEVQQ